jgi:hypothetical protein
MSANLARRILAIAVLLGSLALAFGVPPSSALAVDCPDQSANRGLPAASGTSLWDASTTPDVPSTTDTNAVELGLKFRSTVAGNVTGVRFYKGPNNPGPHVANLWSSAGELLASATFAGETPSGWQQVSFTAPVPVAADTTYVASYHAPNGGYAANGSYFLVGGFSNPPLQALDNATAGGNGVYRYGPSAFPFESFCGTNYWVDVVFSQPGGASDPTPIPTDTPTDTPTPAPTPPPTNTPTNTPIPTPVACTAGYWKQPHHLDSWTGFTPDQTLESVFDVPDAFGLDNTTLLAALEFQGAEILLRQAVAALLDAAHPAVDYPLSVDQVRAEVDAALATGDRSTILALASRLDGLNGQGCPLS